MKKKIAIIFAFLFVLGFAFAEDDAFMPDRQFIRKYLYANDPVKKVRELTLSQEAICSLMAFDWKMDGNGPLNKTDTELANYLFRMEVERRQRDSDDFSLFLQDEKEELQEMYDKKEISSDVKLTVDMWIANFKMNISLDKLK